MIIVSTNDFAFKHGLCFPISCTTETSQPALEVYNIILILQSKKQAQR